MHARAAKLAAMTRIPASLGGQPKAARADVGDLLRHWRQQRHLSQLDLATQADISTRHLSYMETGRALPSRAMVLRLAERLAVPLRERNALLVAAGYAPLYRQRSLDDPALAAARQALEAVLKGHEPYPALLVDRYWNLVSCNRAVPLFLQSLGLTLDGPVNVLRLSLDPQGLAPHIVNLGVWRHHLLERLQRQIEASGDPELVALAESLHALPAPEAPVTDGPLAPEASVVVPFEVQSPWGRLSFISTITVFGTPVDITLSELALETFFPADEATATVLREVMAASPG